MFLPLFRHGAAQRIAQAGGQHQRLDRPLVGRQLQGFQAHARGWIAGDLDDLEAQQIGQLQQAVIGRRLGRDQIARTGQHAQGHLQRIDAAVGDHHFRRIDHHAGIAHADRHLSAQRLETGAEHVTESPRAMETSDFGQLLMQRPHRQIVDTRHRSAQREDTFTTGLDQDLLNDAAAGDQPGALDPGDVRRRRGECRRLVHVVTRLRPGADQPLIFEIGIRLQHRRMTDIELRAHLAHRRHALSRLIDPSADVFGQLLSNTLIEQKIGHDAALDFTGILFLCETIPEQFRSVRGQLPQ
ncbi:hypothetical protein D3C76_871930 [compost metagenome]